MVSVATLAMLRNTRRALRHESCELALDRLANANAPTLEAAVHTSLLDR
jgi:hypothetical protein